MRACACESRAQRHLAAAAAALRNQSGAGRVSRNWSAREERLPLQIIGVFFPPFSLSFATLPDEIKVSELIIGEKEEENWPARARRRRRYATTRSPRVVQSRAGGRANLSRLHAGQTIWPVAQKHVPLLKPTRTVRRRPLGSFVGGATIRFHSSPLA